MDVINYKGGRALFIDSEDLMKMDARDLGTTMGPTEAAVRHTIENRAVLKINAVIIVTTMQFKAIPKFLRDEMSRDALKANCFRLEYWW